MLELEITISQTHSNSRTHHKSITVSFQMTNYLQGKYGHGNTYRFVCQLKKDSFAFSNGGTPDSAPARPGSCRGGAVCGTHIKQTQKIKNGDKKLRAST